MPTTISSAAALHRYRAAVTSLLDLLSEATLKRWDRPAGDCTMNDLLVCASPSDVDALIALTGIHEPSRLRQVINRAHGMHRRGTDVPLREFLLADSTPCIILDVPTGQDGPLSRATAEVEPRQPAFGCYVHMQRDHAARWLAHSARPRHRGRCPHA